jgi:hypothetical protein
MKTPRTNASAVDTQFDEWAKAVAHGLTRRKILQLLGGGFTGALVALRGQKAWADPSPGTKGCGHICAPLFNPQNQGAFAACTQACEDCKSCQGIPTMTSTQVLVCNNATPCRNGGGLACCSGGQNCCLNVSTNTGTCCTGDCCQGTCYPTSCPAGRDPQTCQCNPQFATNRLMCQCNDFSVQENCVSAPCLLGVCQDNPAMNAACETICANNRGYSATCSCCQPCAPCAG